MLVKFFFNFNQKRVQFPLRGGATSRRRLERRALRGYGGQERKLVTYPRSFHVRHSFGTNRARSGGGRCGPELFLSVYASIKVTPQKNCASGKTCVVLRKNRTKLSPNVCRRLQIDPVDHVAAFFLVGNDARLAEDAQVVRDTGL